MLEAIFSFRGRLSRLQYFLGSIGLGFGLVVALVVAGILMGASGAFSSFRTAALPIVAIILLIMPPYFWIAFSLQARRFRDMGWSPTFAILGWIGADFFCELAARAMPDKLFMLSLLLNLCMGGCLLFWPSRREDDDFAPSAPVTRWASPAPAAPARAAPASYYPAPTPAGTPGAFGRRR